ncbi:hypothetical protein NPIL_171711 [Nephila pilipes]|uniref:Uncharacterized protein n=1 Tax=Nephila pilipes TaxID=299642 RepID=A0A8X6UEW8_NEPPI|nr:hypothetical protein NPIL_171711 [Nephila pilipes]
MAAYACFAANCCVLQSAATLSILLPWSKFWLWQKNGIRNTASAKSEIVMVRKLNSRPAKLKENFSYSCLHNCEIINTQKYGSKEEEPENEEGVKH